MVAGDTHLCDMGAIAMSRIALLRREIADRWVRLLRGNRVESGVAAGCYQHPAATTHPSDVTRGAGCMKPTQISCADLPDHTPQALARRIIRYVQVDDNGCWLWVGGTRLHGGYKQIRNGNRTKALAHRVTYALCVGPIPDGLVIDHLCNVPACCNPEHLEPVTHAENIRRRDERCGQRRLERAEALEHWKLRALKAEAELARLKSGQAVMPR